MKIKTFGIGMIPGNVRRISDEDKKDVKSKIADQLASGAVTLGEGLRLMRLSVGMSQAQYAEMVGVDLRVLAAVEKGEGNPRYDTLQKMGRPFGLTVSFVKQTADTR